MILMHLSFDIIQLHLAEFVITNDQMCIGAIVYRYLRFNEFGKLGLGRSSSGLLKVLDQKHSSYT